MSEEAQAATLCPVKSIVQVCRCEHVGEYSTQVESTRSHLHGRIYTTEPIVRALFLDDRRIVRRWAWWRGQIGHRTENDLIELDTIFSHLNAQRVRAAGRERDGCRLREPVCAVLPAPGVEAHGGAVGREVDEQPVRRADLINRRPAHL